MSLLNTCCLWMSNILLFSRTYNLIRCVSNLSIKIPRNVAKTQNSGSSLSSLSFWSSNFIKELNHSCMQLVPRGDWCCWSQGHTLRTTGILWRTLRVKRVYLHFRPGSDLDICVTLKKLWTSGNFSLLTVKWQYPHFMGLLWD